MEDGTKEEKEILAHDDLKTCKFIILPIVPFLFSKSPWMKREDLGLGVHNLHVAASYLKILEIPART